MGDEADDASLSIHDLSRRSTCDFAASCNTRQSFNSRPLKEVDPAMRHSSIHPDLSIHDLSRRSTAVIPLSFNSFSTFNSRPLKEVDHWKAAVVDGENVLSIHDLSRRSTLTEDIFKVDLNFQFTTSQGGRLPPFSTICVANLFQFTTSQGGRRPLSDAQSPGGHFQFTTSQGGRRRL